MIIKVTKDKEAESSTDNFNAASARIKPSISSATPKRTFSRLDIQRAQQLAKTAGALDVTRTGPTFNDPRYTSSTLSIPTDERTLNGLYRFFIETDPIVGAALKMLTDLPLADLQLGQCEDSGIQQHYEEMWERINGLKLLTDIASEYYGLGNSVVFGNFNEADYMWDQLVILNPDYVKIESTWVNQHPLIKLIPDEGLKRIVQTQSPRFLYDQLPPEIIHYVLFNQEIPLDPNNVFHLAHFKRPYEVKGHSIIKRILKTLMLEDRYNQANFALATRHAVPLTIVKVGDQKNNWIPSDEALDEVRELMSSYELDPNFSIIYHYGIDVQYYGSNGKMLPINPELERVYRLKFIGLGVHEQLLAGVGGAYSQAYVNLEVQRQRYLNFQLKLESFMHTGIFKPVADLCGFYKVKQAVAGFGGVSSYKFGKVEATRQSILSAYPSLRDQQDNKQFQEFVRHKTAEYQANSVKQTREYIYPKLDWGTMSASTDENLKNYVKWLVKERPYLVDDALLARLANLDRDTQEKAYLKDLERSAKRTKAVNNLGLSEFTKNQKGAGGDFGGDFGGGGDLNFGAGGGADAGAFGGGTFGEEPNAPIGENGPPEAANAQTPNVSAQSSYLDEEEKLRKLALTEDRLIASENLKLIKLKTEEDKAIVREVFR